MIAQTMYACLTGEERRRHELYANDKTSLLYKLILSDSADDSSIDKLVIQLDEKAKKVIDEEEKQARRNA